MQRTLLLWILVITPASLGCGAAGDSAFAPSPGGEGGNGARPCFGANDCLPGQQCNTFGFCAALPDGGAPTGPDAGVPPEVEDRYDPPASGKTQVYVAVADQNLVVKIDAATLAVRTIAVGHDPGALRTVPGQDVAVVLNRGDATATLLRSRTDGGDDIQTLPTVQGLNHIAIAPDGRHAVAYYDPARARGWMLPKQALQEVTLLRLDAGQVGAVDLSVGFRPSDVQFSSDGSRAFVITEEGISIVELTGALQPAMVPTLPLLTNPLTEQEPSEVLVTADGALAVARLPGHAALRAVDLADGTITDVTLPGVPTDVDLTADGRLAIAVLRAEGQAVFLDLPADVTDPGGIETVSTGDGAGQITLAPDGRHAFLFTNAVDKEAVLIANLQTRAVAVRLLQKGVRAIRPAPDGRTALILHNKRPGAPLQSDDLDGFIDKHEAYSVLDLASGFVKLQLTDAEPGQTAFSADGSAAFVMIADRALDLRTIELVDLQTFLVRGVTVASHPVALGTVPATAHVYVAQSHALGRVTFIEPSTTKTRTLTGFALNSQVIE